MTRKPEIRRGFSMIELLIVVAVSMLLIAIAIPFVQPMLASGKLREASRQVNTFIVGAKARAAESGRPFGIRLVRSSVDDSGDPNECYRIQYVEVPPAYSGDLDNAKIMVGPRQAGFSPISDANPYVALAGSMLAFSAWLSSDPVNDQTATSSLLVLSCQQFVANSGETNQEAWERAMREAPIAPGDFIRFGYQGVYYLICDMYIDTSTSPQPTPRLTLAPAPGAGAVPIGYPGYNHWPVNPAQGVNTPYSVPQVKTYQILRRPRVAGSTTLELPVDTSIDLSMSGISVGGCEFFAGNDPIDIYNQTNGTDTYNSDYRDPTPVDIVFDPSGQLTMIVTHGVVQPATGSVYLLVGRTEHVLSGVGGKGPLNPAFPTPESVIAASQNLTSNDVYWVAIQYPTGAVLTAENIGSHGGSLAIAREFVRSGIATGSR